MTGLFPSIGRIVHYWPTPQDGKIGPVGTPVAAVVQTVLGDSYTVGLGIFGVKGLVQSAAVPFSANGAVGTWSYPNANPGHT